MINSLFFYIILQLKSVFNLVNPFSVKNYGPKIYVSNSGVVPPPFFHGDNAINPLYVFLHVL